MVCRTEQLFFNLHGSGINMIHSWCVCVGGGGVLNWRGSHIIQATWVLEHHIFRLPHRRSEASVALTKLGLVTNVIWGSTVTQNNPLPYDIPLGPFLLEVATPGSSLDNADEDQVSLEQVNSTYMYM